MLTPKEIEKAAQAYEDRATGNNRGDVVLKRIAKLIRSNIATEEAYEKSSYAPPKLEVVESLPEDD